MNTAQQLLRLTDHLKSLAVTNKPVAVITGATGAIGRAMVKELASDYAIVAQGRDEARLLALTRLDEEIYPVQCDLNNTADFVATFGRLPRVDALLHAATIAPQFSFDDASAAIWAEVLHLNVTVPSELTRVLLPQLREATGAVVFLGSTASHRPSPHNVVYEASKHALRALADGIRERTAADHIRVATVALGSADSPQIPWDTAQSQLPDPADVQAQIQPSTIARTIRHVIEAPADAQLTEVWIQPRGEA